MLSKVVLNAVNHRAPRLSIHPSLYPGRWFVALYLGSKPQASPVEKKKETRTHITRRRSRPGFQTHLPSRRPSARRHFHQPCEGVLRSRGLLASSER